MGTQHLKKNNYSNVLMTTPDNVPMFRCGRKKLNWYLSRELAEIVSDGEEIVARFLFEPKGFGWAYDDYFLSVKDNICVVCGIDSELTRHHVIPYCYRRYFPDEIKSHNSYDIVLLCIEHHETYEDHALHLKRTLALQHEAPLNGVGGEYDIRLGKANAFKRSLLRDNNIPADRRHEMLSFVRQVAEDYHNTKYDIFDVETLRKLRDFDCAVRPHTQHGELVVKHYDPDNFAIMWRQHFVDHMEPQCLPDYWHVERRVYREAQEKQVAEPGSFEKD